MGRIGGGVPERTPVRHYRCGGETNRGKIHTAVPRVETCFTGVGIFRVSGIGHPIGIWRHADCFGIAVTDFGSTEELGAVLRLGFDDYLLAPVRETEVLCRTRHWLGIAQRAGGICADLRQTPAMKGLIGESPVLVAELQKLPRFARTDA